jgi:hypothetical protein
MLTSESIICSGVVIGLVLIIMRCDPRGLDSPGSNSGLMLLCSWSGYASFIGRAGWAQPGGKVGKSGAGSESITGSAGASSFASVLGLASTDLMVLRLSLSV